MLIIFSPTYNIQSTTPAHVPFRWPFELATAVLQKSCSTQEQSASTAVGPFSTATVF